MPGDVGIEAVELSILRAEDGIDRADLGGERIGTLQQRHHLLLERHGDAETLDWNFARELEEVLGLGGLQRKVDGVDGLAAEGGVHHQGRERAAYRVSGDAVDLGGCVDLLDPVGFDEGAGGDLAGSRLLAYGGSGEGERRAGAQAEHAGDDAGFPHADADDRGVRLVVDLAEEAHEREVVRQRTRGGNQLDVVRLEGLHALIDRVEVLSSVKVVIAEHNGGTGFTQLRDRVGRQLLDGLEFEVDKLKTDRGGVQQDLQGRRPRTLEATAVFGAAACGDGCSSTVFGQKSLQSGQSGRRFGKIIEPKLEKGRLFEHAGGAIDHLMRGAAGDGDTEFTNA